MEKVGALGSGAGSGPVIRLPPGFRFHPTDEELVMQYLRRKVLSCPLPASIIPDIELSRFDPWDLPVGGVISSSEKEKYFFNRKEAKYRIGRRFNRAAGSGYWKATGRDRQVMSSRGDQVVGIKKFLVFYRGKPPYGSRTDWVMHEYYLAGSTTAGDRDSNAPQNKNSTTHVGDWVLCHVFLKKRSDASSVSEMVVESRVDEVITAARGRIRFINFMGQSNSDSAPPASESSCLTEVSSESNNEEEGYGFCTTSPLFPCSNKEP